MNKFYLSKRANLDLIIKNLEQRLNKMDYSGLRQVDPSIDVKKAYQIICTLESNCSFVVGDSNTSYGQTQVQLGSFLNGLARDSATKRLTGVDPNKFKNLANTWQDLKKQMRRQSFWKQVPIDTNKVYSYMRSNPKDVVKRREGKTVRMNPSSLPGFVKIINGQPVGYEIDVDKLRNLGLDVEKNLPKIQDIADKYITNAVAHNGIIKLFMSQVDPNTYNAFRNIFSKKNVRKNKNLQNLSDRVSQRNLMQKIRYVLNSVRESGYDTSAKDAYNIYQLIGIANASGVGRVRQFLVGKKPFSAGHLHYLNRANPMISNITGIPTSFPANKGLGGFTQKFASLEKEELCFPGQYINDIKSGKRRMTIRTDSIKSKPGSTVKCMTYSGAYVCDLFIVSVEHMSITRIKKAFGKRVANSLEQRFGPDNRFFVIRFDVEDKDQSTNDYSGSTYGKYTMLPDNLDEDPSSLDTGAITTYQPIGMYPNDGLTHYALSKRHVLEKVGQWYEREFIWFWDPVKKEMFYYLNHDGGKNSEPHHDHISLANSVGSDIRFSSKDFRGYVYFFKNEDEGEIHLYSGDAEKMPYELKKKLKQLSKGELETKQIEAPKKEIYMTQEKKRQFDDHMEKRRWMGFDSPDSNFMSLLDSKFGSFLHKLWKVAEDEDMLEEISRSPEMESVFKKLDTSIMGEIEGEIKAETKTIGKEEAKELIKKHLSQKSKEYLEHLKSLTGDELRNYILSPEEVEKAEKSAEEIYQKMIEFVISQGKYSQEEFQQYIDKKEESEKEESEKEESEKEEYVDDSENVILPTPEEKKEAVPEFMDHKLQVPDKNNGKLNFKMELTEQMVYDSVAPHMRDKITPEQIAEIINTFDPKKVFEVEKNKGVWDEHAASKNLQKIFNHLPTWTLLNNFPGLGQKIVLPMLIRSIGRKFLREEGKRSNMCNVAPFSMFFDFITQKELDKISEGFDIEDLPNSKAYGVQIRKLITDSTNVYFSKGFEKKEPEQKRRGISSYVYSSLKYEMMRVVANNAGFKEKRKYVCSVCKGKHSEGVSVEPMRQKIPGIYYCPECLRVAEDKEKNELKPLNEQINQSKLTNNKSLMVKLEKEKNNILNEISMRKSQESVPTIHTWCPEVTCPGQRVPLSSIHWENSFFKTQEGQVAREHLRKVGIIDPNEISQSATEKPEKGAKSVKYDFIRNIPLKCPHDGVEFIMKDVIDQGVDEKAGYFWNPFQKLIWEEKGEMDQNVRQDMQSAYKKSSVPNELLDVVKKLSQFSQQLCSKEYYDKYDESVKLIDSIKKELATGNLTENKKEMLKQKAGYALRKLFLYKTVLDLSTEDSETYISWMLGRRIKGKLQTEGKEISFKNVLGRKAKREEVDIPVMKAWANNMFETGDVSVEKTPNVFMLEKWSIPQGQMFSYFVIKKDKDSPNFKLNLKPIKVGNKEKEPAMLKIFNILRLEESKLQSLSPEEINGEVILSKDKARGLAQNADSVLYKKARDTFDLISFPRGIDFEYIMVGATLIHKSADHTGIQDINNVAKKGYSSELWGNFNELIEKVGTKSDSEDDWDDFDDKLESLLDKDASAYDINKLIKDVINIKEQQASDSLFSYKKKRDFNSTKEPEGIKESVNKHRFVIQNHKSKNHHFDLRLENDKGTMSSWAIPKHKLPSEKERLLAKKTEDHPISYAKFEGEIPEGEYGAGKVDIYDSGTYKEIDWQNDKITFKLNGKKSKDTYSLIKTKDDWLLIKNKK